MSVLRVGGARGVCGVWWWRGGGACCITLVIVVRGGGAAGRDAGCVGWRVRGGVWRCVRGGGRGAWGGRRAGVRGGVEAGWWSCSEGRVLGGAR